MSLDIKNIIQDTIFICKKHLERMNFAKAKIHPLFPLKEDVFNHLAPENVAYVDQFIGRFSKLQDAMGGKLFPQVLELTQEVNSPAFIDKLNKLEKIGAISSAAEWTELRAMRNSFAHDYPTDITISMETLNQAFIDSIKLENFLTSCLKFIAKYP